MEEKETGVLQIAGFFVVMILEKSGFLYILYKFFIILCSGKQVQNLSLIHIFFRWYRWPSRLKILPYWPDSYSHGQVPVSYTHLVEKNMKFSQRYAIIAVKYW